MAMYIVLKGGLEIAWYASQEASFQSLVSDVLAVQADSDELEYIYKKFAGIRKAFPIESRSVRWYGEDAKFIVGNLR